MFSWFTNINSPYNGGGGGGGNSIISWSINVFNQLLSYTFYTLFWQLCSIVRPVWWETSSTIEVYEIGGSRVLLSLSGEKAKHEHRGDPDVYRGSGETVNTGLEHAAPWTSCENLRNPVYLYSVLTKENTS